MEPTTMITVMGVLAFLVVMRRRRSGSAGATPGQALEMEAATEADTEEARARDEAFTQFNSDFP